MFCNYKYILGKVNKDAYSYQNLDFIIVDILFI